MPLLETALVAGAGLAGQGLNLGLQGSMNRKTREFAQQQYQMQKKDNLDFWNMQNEFNSPTAQMDRLKAAGLNPNMVYGHGNAIQTAGDIKTPNAPHWSPNAPRVDLAGSAGGAVNTYFDTRIKQAQYDNLKAQNNVLVNDALLKLSQIGQNQSVTGLNRFSLDQRQRLDANVIATADENLRKLTADSSLSLANARWAEPLKKQEFQRNEQILQNLFADLKKKGVEVEKLGVDTYIQRLNADLMKNGINPNDPLWMRMIGRFIADKFNIKNLF